MNNAEGGPESQPRATPWVRIEQDRRTLKEFANTSRSSWHVGYDERHKRKDSRTLSDFAIRVWPPDPRALPWAHIHERLRRFDESTMDFPSFPERGFNLEPVTDDYKPGPKERMLITLVSQQLQLGQPQGLRLRDGG